MPVYTLTYLVFCICSHNYSIIYQKRNVREGNIGKSRAPGGESSLRGGCTGHSTGREPRRVQGQGLKIQTPAPGD